MMYSQVGSAVIAMKRANRAALRVSDMVVPLWGVGLRVSPSPLLGVAGRVATFSFSLSLSRCFRHFSAESLMMAIAVAVAMMICAT